MKIGDIVNTIDGQGEIVDIKHYSRINGGTDRFGVKLVNNKYSYPITYYWPSEIIYA